MLTIGHGNCLTQEKFSYVLSKQASSIFYNKYPNNKITYKSREWKCEM